MSADLYREQVALLLRLLPIVGREEMFALKGGTAINLFVRDLPRLSVDIDLTFLPLTERAAALTAIGEGLQRIGALAIRQIPGATAVVSSRRDAPKVVVSQQGAHVTIEPNTTLRGSVFPPTLRRTTPAVEAEFGQSVSVPVSSEPDLYGGKIVAALDRQHPRDLFDIKLLFDAGGITDEIRTAFVVYLASHGRPMAEVLDPKLKSISDAFAGEFAGMTRVNVSRQELEAARVELIRRLKRDLTRQEREFLLSVKRGEPRWDLMPGVPHLSQLPGIRWKLRNVQELARRPREHNAAIEKLRHVLEA
jgi:predicted nucleotidyltransferase component of viral defense system